MPQPLTAPPKIMLGFVVRQCAIALGHRPSPGELVEWANNQGKGRQRYCIFGRPITLDEARVILRHPGRPVTVRTAAQTLGVTRGRSGLGPSPRASSRDRAGSSR